MGKRLEITKIYFLLARALAAIFAAHHEFIENVLSHHPRKRGGADVFFLLFSASDAFFRTGIGFDKSLRGYHGAKHSPNSAVERDSL